MLADKFVIAGDHKQLPPTVLSDKAKPLMKSLFERFIEYFDEDEQIYTLLQIQYRMNEKLMQFSNKMFYK
jgi:superfamily I DNA and/or RNA helicase